jgi:hypothetical protein
MSRQISLLYFVRALPLLNVTMTGDLPTFASSLFQNVILRLAGWHVAYFATVISTLFKDFLRVFFLQI